MPLSAESLAAAFSTALEAKNSSGVLAAQQLALAYATYASTAIAQTVIPCPMVNPGNPAPLEQALAQALATNKDSPLPFLMAWMSGLPAFWSTAMFKGIPAPPLMLEATSSPGGVSLPNVGGILTALGPPRASAQEASMVLAQAIHDATVSAVVIFADAPPGVLL